MAHYCSGQKGGMHKSPNECVTKTNKRHAMRGTQKCTYLCDEIETETSRGYNDRKEGAMRKKERTMLHIGKTQTENE